MIDLALFVSLGFWALLVGGAYLWLSGLWLNWRGGGCDPRSCDCVDHCG
jgi:hypothetical protein